jgi:predicted permease
MARGMGTVVSCEDLYAVLKFRPLWGLLLGTVTGVLGGGFDWEPAHGLGVAATAALLPVSMIALGAKVAARGILVTWHVAIGVIIRVVVGPAVAAFTVLLLIGNFRTVDAGLLQTAMPPMFGAALLAERRGLDAKLAYSLCGMGLVAACVALPLYGLLLK